MLNTTVDKTLEIGFATSMFQSSGAICGDSNWTMAEHRGTVPSSLQPKPHWLRFEKDLDLMQKVGVNTYRVSIEWSHIEPRKGYFDHQVIARYHSLIQACLQRNIKPMLTLYHFNEPLWFTEIGGFEDEENIKYFVEYCKHMFAFFSPAVSLWCTINEPAIQAFMGYWVGQFPPHHRLNFTKTVLVLKNLLKAHVEVYYALKNIINGKNAQIGIVHSVFKFKPLYSFDPIARMAGHFLNPLTNDLVIEFFKSGTLNYPCRFGEGVQYNDPLAINANDFVGLNFYANLILGPNFSNGYGPTYRRGQSISDMHLPIDPEGFANAIDEIRQLNKPIYITEMGIADKSDILRKKFLYSYFDVIRNKIADGVDIRGVYLWTAWDNYEWSHGNTQSFGFFDATRQPRESVKDLKKIIKWFNSTPISKLAKTCEIRHQSESLEFPKMSNSEEPNNLPQVSQK